MPPVRAFVAVYPPPETVAVLRRLPRPDVDGVRWTSPDQWHVTLRFLGDLADLAAVDAALAAGLRAHQPVMASVGPAVAHFGGRVIHVPVAGLEPLAAAVDEAVRSTVTQPRELPFSGHLTLGRRRGRGRAPLVGQAVSGQFPVDEVVLVRSDLGSAGATHRRVGSYRLRGAVAP